MSHHVQAAQAVHAADGGDQAPHMARHPLRLQKCQVAQGRQGCNHRAERLHKIKGWCAYAVSWQVKQQTDAVSSIAQTLHTWKS